MLWYTNCSDFRYIKILTVHAFKYKTNSKQKKERYCGITYNRVSEEFKNDKIKEENFSLTCSWPVRLYMLYRDMLRMAKKSHFSSQIKVCTISSRYWTRKIGYRKLFSPALMISDFSSWISVLSSTQKLKKFSSKFQLTQHIIIFYFINSNSTIF